MSVAGLSHVGLTDVDVALKFLGPADFGPLRPRGCLDYLIMIIKQIAATVLRIFNYLCGDGQWYNNHSARIVIGQFIAQYTPLQPYSIPVQEKIRLLYEALLLRANGNESCAHGISIHALQSQPRLTVIQDPAEEPASEEAEQNLQHPGNQPSLLLINEETISKPAMLGETNVRPSEQPYRQLMIENTLKAALRCAENAGNYRVDCLCEIVKMQALINIDDALETAKQLPSNSKCDNALIEIVKIQALTDSEAAFATADRIHSHALTHDKAICEIAKAQAKSEPSKALITANLISSYNIWKDSALLEIVKAQVQTNPQEALATASFLQDGAPFSRDKALVVIVKAQALADTELALNALYRIQDANMKITALCALAKVLASINPIQANELLQEALEEAERSHLKNKDLFKIAYAQAFINSTQAMATASLIQQDQYRNRAFNKIAKALALSDPEQAQVSANRASNPLHQVKALCAIAKAQFSINFQLAAQLLEQALEKAKSMPKTLYQDEALCQIAAAQALVTPCHTLDLNTLSTHTAAFQRIIDVMALANPLQAIAAANLIKIYDEKKAAAFCQIANSPAVSVEQSKDCFSQALAIAEGAKGPYSRCRLYCLVLQALRTRF